MQVKVSRLGVIEKAEIDLKPLTVFVGPNNSGKTWLAYMLAGILGRFGWTKYTNAYLAGKVDDIYPSIDIAIDHIMNGGDATIDLVQFVEDFGEAYVNNVAKHAKQWIHEFLSTALVSFEDLEVHFSLGDLKEKAIEEVLKQSLNRQFGVGQAKRKPLLNLLKDSGSPELYILTSTEEGTLEEIPSKAVSNVVTRNVFELLRNALFTDKPIFPTERTTYITYPLGDQIPGLEDDTAKTKRDKRGVRLSGPVSLFFSMIRTTYLMDDLDEESRAELAKNNSAVGTYTNLAQLLEEILSGSIQFSTSEPGLRRGLLFRTSNEKTMEIPVASSMVKELSSIVLYLRYLAEPGDWLIIDEPEMNLHPEAQVKIIEFLAMLVNAGLNVLITTHSTYVVDHLTNLLDAYKHKNQDKIVEMFLLEQKEAFISQEKVSIYSFENGMVKNILGPQGTIDWRTFSDVTKYVERVHFELLGE